MARPAQWRGVLADAVRDPAELCRLLDLPEGIAEQARQSAGRFSLLVPRPFLARMRAGDAADPLLRQVLPTAAETRSRPGFCDDPLQEVQSTCPPGLLWKYPGRLLVVASGRCAVHCRFCFRRHFPYGDQPRFAELCRQALDLVSAEPSIHEVILSGGDPLMLDDDVLADFARHLAKIPHVSRLRVHTRLPVMIPQRVTDELIAWLRGTRLTALVAIHVNHPAEIDDAVADALRRLADAGVPLLSQTVLLRGVNDSVDALAELFRRLVDLRVMPYYLHQLDRVAGAAHFEVSESAGRELIPSLRARLPGYAVPRYVRETPGEPGKRVLA